MKSYIKRAINYTLLMYLQKHNETYCASCILQVPTWAWRWGMEPAFSNYRANYLCLAKVCEWQFHSIVVAGYRQVIMIMILFESFPFHTLTPIIMKTFTNTVLFMLISQNRWLVCSYCIIHVWQAPTLHPLSPTPHPRHLRTPPSPFRPYTHPPSLPTPLPLPFLHPIPPH